MRYNAHVLDWLSAKLHFGRSLCQIANDIRERLGLSRSWY